MHNMSVRTMVVIPKAKRPSGAGFPIGMTAAAADNLFAGELAVVLVCWLFFLWLLLIELMWWLIDSIVL